MNQINKKIKNKTKRRKKKQTKTFIALRCVFGLLS